MSLRFSQKFSFLIGAPFALVAGMASNAFAQAASVPPAQWVGASASSGTYDTPTASRSLSGPGSASSSVSDVNGTGSATIAQGGLPSPFLSASSVAAAAVPAPSNPRGATEVLTSGSGTLVYYAEVVCVSCSLGSTVPIHVSAFGSASNSGIDGGADANLALFFGYGGTGLQNYQFDASAANANSGQSFNVNGVYLAPVNRPFQVDLSVSVGSVAYAYGSPPPEPGADQSERFRQRIRRSLFFAVFELARQGLFNRDERRDRQFAGRRSRPRSRCGAAQSGLPRHCGRVDQGARLPGAVIATNSLLPPQSKRPRQDDWRGFLLLNRRPLLAPSRRVLCRSARRLTEELRPPLPGR